MAVQIQRWQFTVQDYARMRESGILSEDDRVELIDGEVRPMSPIGPLHAAIVNRLTMIISQQLAGSAIVSVQNPIQLDDHSEPQPDLAVLKPRNDFYAHGHPQPGDVILLIEVADTSFDYDREEKVPRYAAAGIGEIWLVNLARQHIERYSEPQHGQYHSMHLFDQGETLESQMLPGLKLNIDLIFG